MQLEINKAEAEEVLLKWAQEKFPGCFNKVEMGGPSYCPKFNFFRAEPEQAEILKVA